jgi:hypothetical protein
MIADLKLTYPSGLATAVIINGFHSQVDKMAKYTSFSASLYFFFLKKIKSYKESNLKKKTKTLCRKQFQGFMKYFSVSFLWGLFQWFFSGKERCGGGFKQFPTFGLKAWKQTYVLICSLLCFFKESF